jgi:hypothetical protein
MGLFSFPEPEEPCRPFPEFSPGLVPASLSFDPDLWYYFSRIKGVLPT